MKTISTYRVVGMITSCIDDDHDGYSWMPGYIMIKTKGKDGEEQIMLDQLPTPYNNYKKAYKLLDTVIELEITKTLKFNDSGCTKCSPGEHKDMNHAGWNPQDLEE